MRLILVLVLLLGVGVSDDVSAQAIFIHSLDMSGTQVVPPAESAASMSGVVFFETGYPFPLRADDPLFIDVSWHGLTGEPQELRLYRGAPGEVGEFVGTLVAAPNVVSGRVFEVALNWWKVGVSELGGLYVVLTTSAFPEGEIRGPIVPEGLNPTVTRSWGELKGSWSQ